MDEYDDDDYDDVDDNDDDTFILKLILLSFLSVEGTISKDR